MITLDQARQLLRAPDLPDEVVERILFGLYDLAGEALTRAARQEPQPATREAATS